MNKIDINIDKNDNDIENIDDYNEEENFEYYKEKDNHGPMTAYYTYIKKLLISYTSYLSTNIDIDHLEEIALEMTTEAVKIARKIHQVYEKYIIKYF